MKGKTKEDELKVMWRQVNNVSEEEATRRLDGAFDILFGEMDKMMKSSE